MSDSFSYSDATCIKMIHEGGCHMIGHLYEKVEICKYEGNWYYVTFCMTDPMNCGGRHAPVPLTYISNGEINEKDLLKYIAETETYMETL